MLDIMQQLVTKGRLSSLAIVALAVATGCSSEDPPVGVDALFEYRVRDFLEHAPAAGASEDQIAILEQALETGEVPIEVYEEAVDRAFRCLREAGFEIEDWGLSDEQYGYPRREYGIPLEVEADPAEMREPWPGSGVEEHRCFAEHSSWVQFAYDAQPSSREAVEARFEPYREAVIECMTRVGVEVDLDLSREELMRVMAEALRDGTTDTDCIREAGYPPG